MDQTEIVVAKPRCPYCHDDIQAEDQKWGCALCMAWHHQSCFDDLNKCATCDSVKLPVALEIIQTINTADRNLSVLVNNSISAQKTTQGAQKALIGELQFLEKFLLERLQEFDIETLLYPAFKGIVFESEVLPVRTVVCNKYRYNIWIECSNRNVRAADLDVYLRSEHYRSLHPIKSKKNTNYDLFQLKYSIVQDENDPYNSGKNSQVVAYSEKDIHFLIQLLHSLLLGNQLKPALEK